MTKVPTTNDIQKIIRPAKASAKSKEQQPHPQSDTVAVHLNLLNALQNIVTL